MKQLVILVHGWSSTNTSTYGELPARLQTEAALGNAPEIDVHHIYLSEYVSFRDDILLEDLSYAFEAAIKRELADLLTNGRQFICITHSTGGPVVRDWWQRLYINAKKPCPMSHLIMLAPANFGSALAQLGKSRLSRIKSWFEGVEPGEGVLNWLELGSCSAWALNKQWICDDKNPAKQKHALFQFVLAGQTIDHKLYDHLNSYTGELGSDGVVRMAAANMNASYYQLTQNSDTSELEITAKDTSPPTAFSVMAGCSHTGANKGILRSIKKEHDDHPTVAAILECLKVNNDKDYQKTCKNFAAQNQRVLAQEKVEVLSRGIFSDSYAIHDQDSMLIFWVRDNRGNIITDFSISLTGKNHLPTALPPGFFIDRQMNSKNNCTLTYYLDYDIMKGSKAVTVNGKQIRPTIPAMGALGLIVNANPEQGLVHYKPANFTASPEYLQEFLKPNQTTLIEIVMDRVLEPDLFTLTLNQTPQSFKDRK